MRSSRTERFAALDEELQDMLLDIARDGAHARWSSGIDEDQALATLRRNENFQVLRSVVLRQRDSWMHNFARGMAHVTEPCRPDERSTRNAATSREPLYYVQHLPRIAERRLEKKEE